VKKEQSLDVELKMTSEQMPQNRGLLRRNHRKAKKMLWGCITRCEIENQSARICCTGYSGRPWTVIPADLTVSTRNRWRSSGHQLTGNRDRAVKWRLKIVLLAHPMLQR